MTRATPLRVLLVDDEAEFGSVLSKVLMRRGMDVTVAVDGPSALKLLAAGRFDVMLLDVKLPGMDGMQVLAEAGRLAADLPVILMTGHLGAVDQDSPPAGAFAVVLKPHPIPELVALIERAGMTRGSA